MRSLQNDAAEWMVHEANEVMMDIYRKKTEKEDTPPLAFDGGDEQEEEGEGGGAVDELLDDGSDYEWNVHKYTQQQQTQAQLELLQQEIQLLKQQQQSDGAAGMSYTSKLESVIAEVLKTQGFSDEEIKMVENQPQLIDQLLNAKKPDPQLSDPQAPDPQAPDPQAPGGLPSDVQTAVHDQGITIT